ncbi:MAG: cupin domain-containing protein, partial [Pseudomonadota bacterium]
GKVISREDAAAGHAMDVPYVIKPLDQGSSIGVFIVREGRARYTVGTETFEAEGGDIVFGPANVPHKFVNLGPGRLESTDIHLSPEWIQTDLEDPEPDNG